MKKTASFMYAVIFAVSMALIAVFIVVLIGKYDYRWVYSEEIPDINPEYEQLNVDATSSSETTLPKNENLKSMIDVKDINGWELADGYYKCELELTETLGGPARISYIEYTLYEHNVCYGVYYESFTEGGREEFALINGLETLNWNVKLPFSTYITLLRAKVVWTDEDGNIGEKTITVNYGASSTAE